MLIIGFLAGLAAHLPKRFAAHRRASKAEKRAGDLETRLAAAQLSAAQSSAAQLHDEGRSPRITP